jgi:hypothetical protein
MFDNTAPDPITPARAAAWDNTGPTGKSVSLGAAFDNTSPFPDSTPIGKGFSLAPNTGPDANTVSLATAFNNTGATENTGGISGGVADMTATEPTAKSVGLGTAFDNTPPTADSSVADKGFGSVTNVAPSANNVTVQTSFDNNPPTPIDLSAQGDFTVSGATGIVLQGEISPVAGNTTPASPIAVPFNTTLVAGTNYLVEVGGRASIVTVTLPDPPSLTQRIEIADVSGHGSAFPITVNAGTKVISDTNSSTYSIDRSYAVLVLSYTGTAWKIL